MSNIETLEREEVSAVEQVQKQNHIIKYTPVKSCATKLSECTEPQDVNLLDYIKKPKPILKSDVGVGELKEVKGKSKKSQINELKAYDATAACFCSYGNTPTVDEKGVINYRNSQNIVEQFAIVLDFDKGDLSIDEFMARMPFNYALNTSITSEFTKDKVKYHVIVPLEVPIPVGKIQPTDVNKILFYIQLFMHCKIYDISPRELASQASNIPEESSFRGELNKICSNDLSQARLNQLILDPAIASPMQQHFYRAEHNFNLKQFNREDDEFYEFKVFFDKFTLDNEIKMDFTPQVKGAKGEKIKIDGWWLEVFERINTENNLRDVLIDMGCKQESSTRFLAPNSESGSAGLVVFEGANGFPVVYSHHSNDRFFEHGKTYDAFEILSRSKFQELSKRDANNAYIKLKAKEYGINGAHKSDLKSKLWGVEGDEVDEEEKRINADIEEMIRKYESDDTDSFAQDIELNNFLFNDEPAEERNYLIKDYLPAGIPFLLTASGGTGKSYFALQMLICLAAGIKFMGYDVKEPTKVIGIFGEDDRNELKIRIQAVLKGLENDGFKIDKAILSENFSVLSGVGKNMMLVKADGSSMKMTKRPAQLIKAIRKHDAKLCILDPLRKLNNGDENSNHLQNMFIESIEIISKYTECCIGLIHHAAKGDAKGARGASALVDGARHHISLERCENSVVNVTTEKSNYVATGTAFEVTLEPILQGAYMKRVDDEDILIKYSKLIDVMRKNEENGNIEANSKTQLGGLDASTTGVPKKKIPMVINELIAAGVVVIATGKTGHQTHKLA